MQSSQPSLHLGVELSERRISAGLFDAHWRVVGKATTSTKPERVASAVLDRLARCALDAVDEADAVPEDVFVLGMVLQDATGRLANLMQGRSHSSVSPLTVELGRRLPANLARRLVTADYFKTVVWAAQAVQFAGVFSRVLVFFPELVPVARLYDVVGIHEVALPGRQGNPDEPAGTTLANTLLHLLPRTRPDAVLLVGQSFGEFDTHELRILRTQLQEAGHVMPVRGLEVGSMVGPWAAACLAAKTFAAIGE